MNNVTRMYQTTSRKVKTNSCVLLPIIAMIFEQSQHRSYLQVSRKLCGVVYLYVGHLQCPFNSTGDCTHILTRCGL